MGKANGMRAAAFCAGVSLVLLCLAAGRAAASWGWPPRGYPEARALVEDTIRRARSPEDATWRLTGLLTDERPVVELAAADALKKRHINAEQMRRLEEIVAKYPYCDQFSDVRGPGWGGISGKHAWDVLAAAKQRSLSQQGFIDWLISEFPHCRPFRPSRSESATTLLEKMGNPAEGALLRVLREGNDNAQLWAAGRALRRIHTPKARVALESWALRVLEKTSDDLALTCAAGCLAELKSRRAYGPLVRMMWSRLDSLSSRVLLGVAGTLGGKRAIPELRRVLVRREHVEPCAQCYDPFVVAAGTLVTLGDKEGRVALERAAKSKFWQRRRDSAQEIAFRLRRAGVPVLERLAKDKDARVARSAEFNLTEVRRRTAPSARRLLGLIASEKKRQQARH